MCVCVCCVCVCVCVCVWREREREREREKERKAIFLKINNICDIQDALNTLFNGISTFLCYLLPNPPF